MGVFIIKKYMHESKKKALISLKKARSSLDKNIELIENDTYCGDIIVQNLSVIGLIKSSNTKLLEAFIELCDSDSDRKKQDIIQIFKLLQK